jgi:hypothetical protein
VLKGGTYKNRPTISKRVWSIWWLVWLPPKKGRFDSCHPLQARMTTSGVSPKVALVPFESVTGGEAYKRRAAARRSTLYKGEGRIRGI